LYITSETNTRYGETPWTRLRRRPGRGCLLFVAVLMMISAAANAQIEPEPSHECHIFGYIHDGMSASSGILKTLCDGLQGESRPGRDAVCDDGWGFGYFLAPAIPGITRPMLIKSGAASVADTARWEAARLEVEAHGFGAPSSVLGHVRASSYGPDNGALPNPHPFADSLLGRWWCFSHNGHMKPDTLLPWLPAEFITAHPFDYVPTHVDSEVLFRYCLYEINQHHGNVGKALTKVFGRVKAYDDFVFNICLTDGDTLWTAHTLSYTDFYYEPTGPDSSGWWASTVRQDTTSVPMKMDHLYWFTPGAMGEVSYE
jgi:Glutamine amidotransferases class-II